MKTPNHKWHKLYFALAAFDILAIGVSMAMSHYQLKQYQAVVEADTKILVILQGVSNLAASASKTNAPGNNVFETRQALLEQEEFNKQLRQFQNEIVSVKNLTKSHDFNAEEHAAVQAIFDQIQSAMNEMTLEARSIFTHMLNSRETKAASRMAQMDRSYATVLANVEKLRTACLQKQTQVLQTHKADFELSRKVEQLFFILVVLAVIGIAVYGSKMTHFMQAAALKDKQIASVLNSSADAIMGLDREGHILSWNLSAARLFGVDSERAVGRSINEFLIRGKKSNEAFDFKATFNGQEIRHLELRGLPKNGRAFDVSVSISAILDEAGHLTGASAIVRDISELMKMQNELSKIFDLSSELICITDKTGVIKRINPSFHQILGFDDSDLVSQPMLNFIHEEDFSVTTQNLKSLQMRQHSVEFENRFRSRNGGYRVFAWSAQIETETGDIYFIARDMTEARRIAQEQEVLRNNLEEAQLVGKVGSWHYNPLIHTFTCSKQFFSILKLNPAHKVMLDSIVLSRLSESDRVEFKNCLEHTLQTGKVTKKHFELSDESESTWIEFTFSPKLSSQGAAIGVHGSCQDITERVRSEHQIEFARNRSMASSKMASLGEMAGGIAHEINNPLGIVRGRSQQLLRLIQDDNFDRATSNKYIETIINTCDRIAKIIMGLRTFSRNADNDPSTNTSIEKVISDTVALCQEKYKNNGVSLHLPAQCEYQVLGRSVQLSQVLLNLLNNAFDAVLELEDKWVRVEVNSHEDHLDLSVVDSGSGIPPEVVDKMMQPFFTTKPEGKGTGLGLSVSLSLVASHGGKLFYDQTSKNTRFVVRLPLFKNQPKGAAA